MIFSEQSRPLVRTCPYLVVVTLVALMTACGDVDDFESVVEVQGDTVHTHNHMRELRTRPSKICDGPPALRVFYSPQAEPDCEWIYEHITGTKARRRADQDEMSHSRHDEADNAAAASRSTLADKPEPATLKCYTVFPEGVIIGPHPCNETPTHFENNVIIDVSAGGSSPLDTRRVSHDSDDSRLRDHD